MNSLEELLNKLIEKGRVPFGEKQIKEVNYVKHHGTLCWYFRGGSCQRWKPIRELVSKESGLWHFVCENKLENSKEWKQRTDLDEDDREYVKYSTKFYEYRLIESALCDEDKLEQFLLNNIKIDE